MARGLLRGLVCFSCWEFQRWQRSPVMDIDKSKHTQSSGNADFLVTKQVEALERGIFIGENDAEAG